MNNMLIGMIVPTSDNSFFSSLTHNIEKELSKYNYQLIIADSDNNAEKENNYLKLLSSICVGIIDISGLEELDDNILPKDYPLVLVDRVVRNNRNIPIVSNDDEKATYEATTYLIKKNCKNILLMPGLVAQNQNSPRINGYRQAIIDNNITFDETYVLKRKGLKSSEDETKDLLMEILRQNKKIDGLITSSDKAAFGAMKALGLLGYYAPEDIKLISFDNTPYSTLSSPSITSIDRNPEAIGLKTVEVLINIINKKEIEKENIIPVSLVERDSTR